MYAIVDIETTGSYAAANGITEIAVYIHDGTSVIEKFETLVNPLQTIPPFIERFTGITNAMVQDAPVFASIAPKIYALLHNKIFVAHNVNFDYSFIKSGLEAAGFHFHSNKLCTVRMSRKIFPGLRSYSLGNLCDSLGITIQNRHRAAGDAWATVQVLDLLLKHDTQQHIAGSLHRHSKEQILPPHVPKPNFEQLPNSPGVYYFHNQKGKIIYVGKALNIRQRVNSHFSNNSDSRQKQHFLTHTHSITFQQTATELMACLLESTEIKRLWPVFNYAQKKWEDVYGIFSYTDQQGYTRLCIEKNKKHLRPVFSFHYLKDGHAMLRQLIHSFELCARLCSLHKTNDACDGYSTNACKGACIGQEPLDAYNKRVQDAIQSLQSQPSYVIVDEGLHPGEQSCIMVWEGKFFGMGYVPRHLPVTETITLKKFIRPYRENSFTRNLVAGYAAKNPGKIIPLTHTRFNPYTENTALLTLF